MVDPVEPLPLKFDTDKTRLELNAATDMDAKLNVPEIVNVWPAPTVGEGQYHKFTVPDEIPVFKNDPACVQTLRYQI